MQFPRRGHTRPAVRRRRAAAVRPPGVPTPSECGHKCANCHRYGRMSFDEQRQHQETAAPRQAFAHRVLMFADATDATDAFDLDDVVRDR